MMITADISSVTDDTVSTLPCMHVCAPSGVTSPLHDHTRLATGRSAVMYVHVVAGAPSLAPKAGNSLIARQSIVHSLCRTYHDKDVKEDYGDDKCKERGHGDHQQAVSPPVLTLLVVQVD